MLTFFSKLLHVEPIFWILWIGLGLLTIALIVLMRTDWGRTKPLRKCIVLSLMAHLLLAYAAMVTIYGSPGPAGEDSGMLFTSVDSVEEADDNPQSAEGGKPWEQTPLRPNETPKPSEAERRDTEPTLRPDREMPQPPRPLEIPPLPPVGDAVKPEDLLPIPDNRDIPTANAHKPVQAGESIDEDNLRRPKKQDPTNVEPMPQGPAPRPLSDAKPQPPQPTRGQLGMNSPHAAPLAEPDDPAAVMEPRDRRAATHEPKTSNPVPDAVRDDWQTVKRPQARPPAPRRIDVAAGARRPFDRAAPGHEPPSTGDHELTVKADVGRSQRPHPVPEIYANRDQADRQDVVARGGGSPDTEAAVRAALAWLAENQEKDGRWDAARHGAVRARWVDGNNELVDGDTRNGMNVDSGVTGLALLAFLGAGNTHQAGLYQENVRAGLNYLIGQQADDGNLFGPAAGGRNFAAMYCHGMATLALAEAYGMTADPDLRQPLRRAVDYSLAAQSPSHGGWRYRPQDRRGDTSQLGWQLMALKAAEQAGLDIPVASRHGMMRFLDSVSSGKHRGLASYRAGDEVSHAMTAEALFCRLLLGTTTDNPLCEEAGEEILRHLPGGGDPNLYYWYYATLATYQLQGRYWQIWNPAMQKQLLKLQSRDGSWSRSTRYGGHGGRVYTTAIATLCLEVYYRYVPKSLARRPGVPGSWR